MSEQQTQDQQLETSPNEDSYGVSEQQEKLVIEALDANDTEKCRALLDEHHPADIADLFSVMSHELRERFVNVIKADFDPDILVELDSDLREEMITLLGIKKSAKAIGELETDDAVDVLVYMDEDDQKELLDALPQEQREELTESLAYPEDSAGRLVEKNLVAVPEYWTVGETIDYLRSNKDLPEDFYQIFVVDPKHKPIAFVSLSHIMRSKRSVKINEIMNSDVKTISTDTDQEEVAFLFRQYGLASAPVVNAEGRMIGTISIDDVIDVVDEEAHEDLLRMGGVASTDLHTHFSETVGRRFPWLFINLLTAIAASAVIALFEGTIERMAALAILMPIMASMGGNAGTQTLTIMIRGLATKELTATNSLRVIGKESLVGCMNGLLFAAISGAIAYFWFGDMQLSVVLGLAAVATMFAAALAGALIPLGLEKLGADPAISSGVFLTTITDVVAFGVFLGLATLLLLQ